MGEKDILSKLKSSISQFFLKIAKVDDPDESHPLRVESIFNKRNIIYVRFQIKGTRGVFSSKIKNIFLDKNVLYGVEPFDLIELGALFKDQETRQEKRLSVKKTKIISFFSETLPRWLLQRKVRAKKTYEMRVAGFQIKEKIFLVEVIVNKTQSSFFVPVNDLKKDFSLLSNIEPTDLIRIGYLLKEEENKAGVAFFMRTLSQ